MILHRIDICNWGVTAKCSPNLQRPANRRWKDICLSSQMHARARPRALAVLSESLTRPCHRLTGCWHNLTSAKCLPLGPDSIYCLNHSSQDTHFFYKLTCYSLCPKYYALIDLLALHTTGKICLLSWMRAKCPPVRPRYRPFTCRAQSNIFPYTFWWELSLYNMFLKTLCLSAEITWHSEIPIIPSLSLCTVPVLRVHIGTVTQY